jgi:hypothetical protein
MVNFYNICFILACMLASLAWPAVCTDEIADTTTLETISPAFITTTAKMHDEMEGSGGSDRGKSTDETSEDIDCTEICRKQWSDYGQKENWHKSEGRTSQHGSEDEGDDQTIAEKRRWSNGSFKIETFKGTWKRDENGTWNGSFERESVKGKWHRRNGTWNGTVEREGVKGEWKRSRNGTMNKSFEHENGEGKWQRTANGTWSSHYEEADRMQHEGNGTRHSGKDRMPHGTRAGKPRCECRKRDGLENEVDATRSEGMNRHHGVSNHTPGDNGWANDIVRSGNFSNASLRDQLKGQTEVSASSNNDQSNGGNSFGNAAVLGLAGAGLAALCVAITMLCICCRRNGKAPLTTGAVRGKNIDNMASSDNEVVAGTVVTTV